MAEKRVQMTITLDPAIAEWMDKEIDSVRFANRSHAIEYCLHHVMTEEQKPKIEESESPHEAVALS